MIYLNQKGEYLSMPVNGNLNGKRLKEVSINLNDIHTLLSMSDEEIRNLLTSITLRDVNERTS